MYTKTNFRDNNLKVATSLLGIDDAPLTPHEMANELRVTFYPEHSESELLGNFTDNLKDVLRDLGTEVIPYNVAKLSNGSGNIEPGVVVIEQGEGEDEADLPHPGFRGNWHVFGHNIVQVSEDMVQLDPT